MDDKTELIFEDDAGNLHTMIVESKDENNRTVTGYTTVWRDGPDKHSVWMERVRVKVTIPDHRLRQ